MYLYCIKEVLPKLTLLFSSCAYPCECASLRVYCADQVWSGCVQRRDGFGPDKCADRCKLARTGQRKLLRAIKAARAVIDTGVTELLHYILHLALHPTDHPRKVELNVLVEVVETLTSEFQLYSQISVLKLIIICQILTLCGLLVLSMYHSVYYSMSESFVLSISPNPKKEICLFICISVLLDALLYIYIFRAVGTSATYLSLHFSLTQTLSFL